MSSWVRIYAVVVCFDNWIAAAFVVVDDDVCDFVDAVSDGVVIAAPYFV